MSSATPIYMLPANHPQLKAHKTVYEGLAAADKHTLNMQVEIALVEEGNCGHVQLVMIGLQHYPHLIEKMIFAFAFTFVDEAGVALPEDTWKREPVFYGWFQKLLQTPFTLFFIADEDTRSYALMADILATGNVGTDVDERSGHIAVDLNKEQEIVVQNRIWDCCTNMLLFCYGTGFDPRIYIEGLMASLHAEFTYEDVLAEFEEVRANKAFRVVPKND